MQARHRAAVVQAVGRHQSTDARTRMVMLRLARSPEEGYAVRALAILAFRASTDPREHEAILGIARAPQEDPAVRMMALASMQAARVVRVGDETYLELLESDPSWELRRRLAASFTGAGPYPAGDAAIARALEGIRAEALNRSEDSTSPR